MKNSLVKHSLPKQCKQILEPLVQYSKSYMHNGNPLRLYTKVLRLTACSHQRLLNQYLIVRPGHAKHV